MAVDFTACEDFQRPALRAAAPRLGGHAAGGGQEGGAEGRGGEEGDLPHVPASFAAHLLGVGNDIHTIHELPGHAGVSTTMIYTHVLNKGARGVRSPLEL